MKEKNAHLIFKEPTLLGVYSISLKKGIIG